MLNGVFLLLSLLALELCELDSTLCSELENENKIKSDRRRGRERERDNLIRNSLGGRARQRLRPTTPLLCSIIMNYNGYMASDK